MRESMHVLVVNQLLQKNAGRAVQQPCIVACLATHSNLEISKHIATKFGKHESNERLNVSIGNDKSLDRHLKEKRIVFFGKAGTEVMERCESE